MTAQTEAQSSTIAILTGALGPTSTYTVESKDFPGAVILTLENEESRKGQGASIYATIAPGGELLKVELGVTIDAGWSAVNVVDVTDDYLGVNLLAMVSRSSLPGGGGWDVADAPVVISGTDLTFEQSEAIQIITGDLRAAVVSTSVSHVAPGAVAVTFRRGPAGDGRPSIVRVELDRRGELVRVALGSAIGADSGVAEPLGMNLRSVLARARN